VPPYVISNPTTINFANQGAFNATVFTAIESTVNPTDSKANQISVFYSVRATI